MLSLRFSSTLGAVAVLGALSVAANVGAQTDSAKTSEKTPVYEFNDVSISMERTPCFGKCPVYSVEIRGDGSGTYRGQQNVSDAGPHIFHLKRAEVLRLLSAFFNARFFELRDKYDDFATAVPRGDDKFAVVMSTESDLPTTVLRLRVAEQTKTIVLRDNFPAELGELTKSIDAVTGSAAWVRGASK